jgi:hypothetical protein
VKKIFNALKKIMFSGLLLYGYNVIAITYNMTIPINLVTVGAISIMGFPALFSLILIKKIIFI